MGDKPKFKRRQFIVDPPMQLSIIFTTLGVLTGLGVFFIAAIFLVPSESLFEMMDGGEARTLLLRLSATYFMFCVSSVLALTVIITHRIAGPAMVIEKAVNGVRTGDFSQRLRLRDKDYLKSLATSVSRLRDRVTEHQGERRRLIEAAVEALDIGEQSRARDVLDEIAALDAPEGASADREPIASGS